MFWMLEANEAQKELNSDLVGCQTTQAQIESVEAYIPTIDVDQKFAAELEATCKDRTLASEYTRCVEACVEARRCCIDQLEILKAEERGEDADPKYKNSHLPKNSPSLYEKEPVNKTWFTMEDYLLTHPEHAKDFDKE